ncbi:MAG TPA: hypothetical protein VFP39_08355 [Gemmatimonadales bacterium]|nr:hypothetical protein [Gemmatimonadales bacterium]
MMHDHDGVHDEGLRQVARRLGAEAAERLDVERTAQTVIARLRAGDAPARASIRWMQPAWLRAAAVVVVIIGAGALYRVTHPVLSSGSVATDRPPADVLADIPPGQLREVLSGLNDPLEMPGAVHAGEAGVEDLSEPQLQSLLEAIPSLKAVED